MRLLLVEDDALLGDGIRAGLRQDGYAVDWVQRGPDALHALAAERFDLVVLDLGLPGMDGIELLRRLRDAGSDVPVLILTARDGLGDRVAGLDAGGDDYLLKPFDLEELCARVRALLRRSRGRATPNLHAGDLTLDPAAHTVTQGGKPVRLSPREFAVLRTLLENAGRTVSRGRLEESIYGWGEELESNAVEVHVHHLRRKLSGALIHTVRGVGYRIDAGA